MTREYLKRTPTSTGNRKVFTWAGWVKRQEDAYQMISFSGSTTISDGLVMFGFNSSGGTGLYLNFYESSNSRVYEVDEEYRDFGSWLHYQIVVDTTQATEDDRLNFYINGVQRSLSVNAGYSAIPQDYLCANMEAGQETLLGTGRNSAGSLSGYSNLELSDVFFVDGQALTPDVFGFYKDGDGYQSSGTTSATDFRSGQWSPRAPKSIKYEINRHGGFGVNGFYLPMNDSSNPGADFHCDPNTIIKLKGEDLPQPRNGAPTTSDAYVSQLRTDPYAANLVFAIPGIATGNGVNLYTNGNFYNDISGWTAGNGATLSHEYEGPDDVGNILVTSGTGSNGYAYTSLSTVVGERYTLSFDYQHVSGQEGYLNVGNTTGASQVIYKNLGTNPSWKRYTFSFVATVAQQFIGFYSRYTSGSTRFANISLIQQDAASDYSADIKGSGTNKTVTTVTYLDANNSSHRTPAITYGHSAYGSYIEYPNDDATGGYLEVSDSTAFDNINLTTAEWTYEGWFKRSDIGSGGLMLMQFGNTVDYQNLGISIHPTGTLYFVWSYDGSDWDVLDSTGGPVIPQDEWCHIAIVKEATPTPRIVCYVNGVAGKSVNVTSNISYTSPDYMRIGGHYRGTAGGGDTYFYNGGMYDIRFYNTVKYKGGFDVSKPYAPVGIESWRTTADTCKNNFATLNPLSYQTTGTPGSSYPVLSDGNLKFTHGQVGQWERSNASFGVGEGKWYFEFQIVSRPTGGTPPNNSENWAVGVRESDSSLFYGESDGFEDSGDHVYWIDANTAKIVSNQDRNAGSTSGISNVVNGDIINIAFEKTATTLKVWFGINGTYFNSGNPSSGTTPAVNVSTTTEYIIPAAAFYQYSGQTEPVGIFNFGQNPTFSRRTTSGTNTDSNGKGLFKYAPPTGFLALCEDNLPTPAIADPGDYMKSVLYTGSETSKGVNDVGFQPDLVWIKERDGDFHNAIYDSVRGPKKSLSFSRTDIAEQNESDGLNGFSSTGFDLSSGTGFYYVNRDAQRYIAWCWKAGGNSNIFNVDGTGYSTASAAGLDSGTITPTGASVGTEQGFSILTYTGNGTAGANISHGLSKAPEIMFHRSRDNGKAWYTITTAIDGSADYLYLSSTVPANNSAVTAPTSNLMYFTSSNESNNLDEDYVVYMWHSVENFSKIGTYVGNGNDDGPMIVCGFKPSWVIVKRVTTGGNEGWPIYDNVRGSYNPNTKGIYTNSQLAENDASGRYKDFLSNGFKIRGTSGEQNTNGVRYLYIAFAESPFSTANAK